MKNLRLLLLIFSGMLALQLAAQDQVYSNFLYEGKNWKLLQIVQTYSSKEVTVLVSGDTIVGGKNCKKLICNDDGNLSLFAVMAEEGQKVYVYYNDKFILVYDFGLTVGDTVSTNIDTVLVAAADTVEYNGKMFKRLLLHRTTGYTPESLPEEFYEYVVEGIGSMYAPNVPYSFQTPGNAFRLLGVFDSEETLIDSDGVTKLFTDEFTGIRPTTSVNPRATGATFDLSGRKILQPQPHQPYIRGGKKYIGR